MLKLFEGEKRAGRKWFLGKEEDAHRACERKRELYKYRTEASRASRRSIMTSWYYDCQVFQGRDAGFSLSKRIKRQETPYPVSFCPQSNKRRRFLPLFVHKETRNSVSCLFFSTKWQETVCLASFCPQSDKRRCIWLLFVHKVAGDGVSGYFVAEKM